MLKLKGQLRNSENTLGYPVPVPEKLDTSKKPSAKMLVVNFSGEGTELEGMGRALMF